MPPKALRVPEAGAARTPSGARRTLPDWIAQRPETIAILTAMVGLFVQVVGYSRGWAGDDGTAIVLWYLGFALIVSPFAALLLLQGRSAHQRLGAVSYTHLTLPTIYSV